MACGGADSAFHFVDIDADAAGYEPIVVGEAVAIADVGEHFGGGADRGDPTFDGVEVEA